MRSARSRVRRRRKKSHAAPKRNPAGSAAVENLKQIGAGFAGFAVTRAISRIASTAVGRKWPRAAKLAGVAAGAVAVVAAELGAPRFDQTARYAESITMGAGVAAAATLVQTLLPRYGWLLAHPSEDTQSVPAQPAMALEQVTAQGSDVPWYYNDGMDAGRYAAPSATPPEPGAPATVTDESNSVDELLASIAQEDGELGQSIFGS